MSKKSKQPDLILGALPVELINRTIDMELEAAEVVLTRAGQVHAARRHPGDYPVCMPHLAGIIASPLYIGDDFKNRGKIELIGRVHAIGTFVLVAIDVEILENGRYRVSSFYTVPDDKVQRRRQRGFLKVAC